MSGLGFGCLGKQAREFGPGVFCVEIGGSRRSGRSVESTLTGALALGWVGKVGRLLVSKVSRPAWLALVWFGGVVQGKVELEAAGGRSATGRSRGRGDRLNWGPAFMAERECPLFSPSSAVLSCPVFLYFLSLH